MSVDEDVRHRVELAKAGDIDAWEWLYRRAYPRLFAFARRRVGTDSQADDVVSETMTRAIEKMSAFEWKGAGFDGWLFAICRNVVLESYRSTNRAVPSDALEVVDVTGDPADSVVSATDHEAMLAALDRLDIDEREIIELRVIGELSSEAVALVVGKSAAAVRMAQSRALSRLRTYWKEGSREH